MLRTAFLTTTIFTCSFMAGCGDDAPPSVDMAAAGDAAGPALDLTGSDGALPAGDLAGADLAGGTDDLAATTGDMASTPDLTPATGWQVLYMSYPPLHYLGRNGAEVCAVGAQNSYCTKGGGLGGSAGTAGLNQTLVGIWGSGSGDLFIVGSSGASPTGPIVGSLVGAAWSYFNASPGTSGSMRSVWGTDGQNAWASGDAGTYRTSDGGKTWAKVSMSGGISFCGSSATDLWMGTSSSGVYHSTNGTDFSVVPGSSSGRLMCAGKDLWLMKTNPGSSLEHSGDGGATWASVTVPGTPKSFWAAGPTDVWVTVAKKIYHATDGKTFTEVAGPSDATEEHRGIAVGGNGKPYVLGKSSGQTTLWVGP